jgi:hypothetical protein
MRLVSTTEEKIIPSNKNLISMEDMDDWIYAHKNRARDMGIPK